MEIGKEVPEEALIDRIRGQAPNKCCTLIYTVSTLVIKSVLSFTNQINGHRGSVDIQ